MLYLYNILNLKLFMLVTKSDSFGLNETDFLSGLFYDNFSAIKQNDIKKVNTFPFWE